ncbi:MAG: hypothetical protein E7265_10690 [Lachnospiraceae bacterium]|nr:hypothetical protein [Lachnospiraceae bacterium]
MDALKKLLLWAAGLIIVLIIIGIMFDLFDRTRETTDNAGKQIDDMNDKLAHAVYTRYTGDDISGSEVLSAISNFWDSQDIFVSVEINGSTTYYVYNDANLTTLLTDSEMASRLAEAKKPVSTKYINPRTVFLGTLVEGPNGGVIGIKYVAQ